MRRSVRVFAVVALCFGVMLTCLWLARKPLAEWAAVAYLAHRGVTPVSLTISELGFDGVQVDDLRIGNATQPHVSVRRVAVVVADLAVTEIQVSGVAVTGNLRDGRPDIGPVMALVDNVEPSGVTARPALAETLPDLTVIGVRVALAGPQGQLALELDGAIELVRGSLTVVGPLRIAGPGSAGQGDLSLKLDSDLTGHGTLAARDVTVGPPWLVQPLRLPLLDLRLNRSSNHASADLEADFANGSIVASLLGVGPFDRPTVDVGIQLDLPSLAPLLPLLRPFAGELPVIDGGGDLSMALTATAGDGPDLATRLGTAVGEVTLAGQAMLVPSEQAAGGQFHEADVILDLDGTFDAQALMLNVNRFTGRVGGLRVSELPDQYRRQIATEASFALEPGWRATVSRSDPAHVTASGAGSIRSGKLLLRAHSRALHLSGEGISVAEAAIEMHGLSVEGLLLETLRFDGDVDVTDTRAVRGRLSGGGSEWEHAAFAVTGPEFALDVDLRASSGEDARGSTNGKFRANSISLNDGELTVHRPQIMLEELAFANAAGKGVSLSAKAQTSQVGISIGLLEAGGPVRIQPQRIGLNLQGIDLAHMTGNFRLSSDGATVPAHVSSGGLVVEGELDLAAAAVAVSARIADIVVDQALLADVPAMAFDATMDADPARIRLAGTAWSGPVAVAVNGALNAVTGAGDVTIELPPTLLALLSDHLRGAVLPEAMALPEGTLSAQMKLKYDNELSGNLNVSVKDGTVATPEVAVAGIDATIQLTSLIPPQTSAPQEVRIARLSGPADMTDMLLRFGLTQDGDETIAQIEHLAGKVFGGELALQPFILRPDEARRAVDVTLSRIDMTQIVKLTGLVGFELTGNLSGTLPVVIVDESQVAVTGGLLRADGPGILRLDGATLRDVLGQQAGEQLDLLIQALEDFRYDMLEIAIDKELEGDADMRITLGGLNPAVLDGHPFRFNISVKGNADRLLATILTIYRASGGVIEQGIKSLQ